MFVGWTYVCLLSIVYVYLFSYTQTHTLIHRHICCTVHKMLVRVCVNRNPLAHNLPLDGFCMPFERASACVCMPVEGSIRDKYKAGNARHN